MGADTYSRALGEFFLDARIMMVEITVMQHKGVSGNVHNPTTQGDRLHVTFRYQGPLLAFLLVKGVSAAA